MLHRPTASSASSSSSSSSTRAADPDVITITDDEDEDDSMSDRPTQPQHTNANNDDDDEAGFFDADDDDADAEDADAADDWGDMTEVNDEADIDALPSHSHHTTHASTPSASRRLSSHDAVSMESCPRDVMRRIEADVREIGLLPSFCASEINFGGRTRVALRVGFPVHSLGMNAEQVRAWTLSNDMDLFVELHLPPHYWSVAPSAIDVTVGQSATRAAPTDLTPLERCKLSWPLENRIRKQFLADLLHEVKPLPDAGWSWEGVEDVVATCDCDWLTAIRALIKAKGDQSRACEEIVKEQASEETDKASRGSKSAGKQESSSSAASGGSDMSFSGMFGQAATALTRVLGKSTRADGRADTDKQDKPTKKKDTKRRKKSIPTPPTPTIADITTNPASTQPPSAAESQVMAACGVSLYVARRGLALCNGEVTAAMDLLCSEETVADLEGEERDSAAAAAATEADSSLLPLGGPGALVKRSSSSTMSFSADSDGPQSEEDQLLTLLAQHNYLVRLLRFIKRKIHTIHSTCILCERQLPFPGLNLSVCESSLCRMSYESMGVGFDIGTAIAAAPVLTDLYISMLASAASSSHLYYARPVTVSATGKDGVETNFLLAKGTAAAAAAAAGAEDEKDRVDYTKLLETINRLPTVAQMVEYIRAGTFVEKMNQLDVLILPLLRWLFQSCPTYVRELSPSERFASIPTPYQFVMLMSSPEKEHRFQQLKVASGKESIWSWHGGPARNWHSIIRTGLKNLSNSKYMAHGAAYGSGVYMAKDSGTSLGYSGGFGYHNSSSYGWSRSAITTNPVFLALCEVVGDAGTFQPFLVVPDEMKVSTRCLFVFGSQQATNVNASDLIKEMHPSLRNFDVQSLHKRK